MGLVAQMDRAAVAKEFEAAIVEAKFSWLKDGDEHEDVSEYVPELVFRVKQVAGD